LECRVGDEVVILTYGRGRHIDTAAHVRACQEPITSSGGEVLLDASGEKLLGEQEVVGVGVRLSDRTLRRLEAPSTVLTTGGLAAAAVFGLRAAATALGSDGLTS
jgi:hypothetical protein